MDPLTAGRSVAVAGSKVLGEARVLSVAELSAKWTG